MKTTGSCLFVIYLLHVRLIMFRNRTYLFVEHWLHICICSKPGHGFQRHMSWSFIYSMSVPSQDMDFNVICYGLLYIQCLFQARTWIPTSYVMVFYIFNVCSKPGHGFQRHMLWSFIYSMCVPSQDMDFNVICRGLLYIQCLFQARTWISTSYVMVFYIFNVCSKPGHGFQRHMSWSFIYSMSVPSQDMDFNVICHGLLYIQCLFQARTCISTSYVVVFYIFNVCSKPGHGFQRHMICHGLLYIQCLFQIRTWISTSYVMVFYIFNVCSKPGHGFQRHMLWSFIYSMSVPSQDMDFNVICHGLLYIQCLFQARTWISTSYVMVFYIFNVCSKPGHGFQRHMSWSFIYSMCVPSQDMDFNVICHGLLYIQCLFQARTCISTSYVVVFYIFNVCSKPGHGFQRHMICHGLLYIQCLFQIRTWISTSYVMVFYIFNVCSKPGHGF